MKVSSWALTSDKAAWTANIGIKNTTIKFKLDTGADVTAVSQTDMNRIFSGTQQPVLQIAERPLLGPGRIPLDVSGFVRLQLRSGVKQTMQKVYVVKHLSTPLLGFPAITALGLLKRVGSIDLDTLKSTYPRLCSGLGEVKRAYHIKLKPNAVPFSLKTPRRIPLPLVGKVKEELQPVAVRQYRPQGHRPS